MKLILTIEVDYEIDDLSGLADINAEIERAVDELRGSGEVTKASLKLDISSVRTSNEIELGNWE